MSKIKELLAKEYRSPMIVLGTFLALNLLYILITTVFPFQDLPQHLTYARIFESYGETSNLFRKYYQLPSQFMTYFTFHYILAFLAKFGGVEAGFKIFLVFYVIFMFSSFLYLVFGIYPNQTKTNLWRGLFFQLIIWNATLGMGFMAYVMAFPFFILGMGALYRVFTKEKTQRSDWVWLSLGLLGLSFCHVVALFSFLFVAAVFYFFKQSSRNLKTLVGMCLFFIIATVGWSGLFGNQGFLNKGFRWGAAFEIAYGFGFINQLFKFQWSNPPVIFNYLSWNYVGAFRLTTLVPMMLLFGASGYFLKKWSDKEKASWEGDSKIFFKVWFVLFLVAVAMPWGLYVPSEITFINYRLMTLSLFLIVANVPQKFLESSKQVNVLIAVMWIWWASYTFNTLRYQKETEVPFKMMESIPPKKVLVSMMFQNKSNYFAKILDLTHFLPMYYSIRWNGINQQFWARYTKHLPIDYKPGMRVAGPADWNPRKFKLDQLRDADYLIFQKDYLSPGRTVQRIQNAVASRMSLQYCKDLWCLYKRRN